MPYKAYGPDDRERAYNVWIGERQSLVATAKKMGINRDTLATWREEGEWEDRADEMRRRFDKAVTDNVVADIRATIRGPVLELMRRMNDKDIETKDLINGLRLMMQHGIVNPDKLMALQSKATLQVLDVAGARAQVGDASDINTDVWDITDAAQLMAEVTSYIEADVTVSNTERSRRASTT